MLRRSTTSSGTKITVYAFGTEEHVYDGSGNHQSDTYYYSLQGRLIGKSDGTNNQFFLTDGLGSVVSSFDANGVVQGNQAYGPYGNKRYNAGSIGTDKGFTGQYQDSTGLDYFNARYYDPVVGRFLSADVTQGNMQGMDPYDYVGGNPASRTDPTGHFMVGENGEKAWTSAGTVYETVPWSSAPPVVIATYNGWQYRPVIHPAIAPRPPEPKPEPAAKPAPPPDPVMSWLTGAGHLLLEGADQFLGVSSMINDWGTLTSDNTSGWDKLWAAGDLAMNIGMDVSMFTGFGEEARVAELAAKGGEELLAHATEDAVAHGAEDVASHAGEDVASHAGEACGGLSFSFATTVATAKGAQAIGTLKVGEKVWAYNPTTKKMELEPIKHVWINHDDDLVDLAISYTAKDKQGHPVQQVDTIHTNKKHPFLTQEKGFTPVADLIPGMHIVRADGSLGTVVAWEVVPGTSTMYNLEVDQDHTFTVSDGQWVVHNCAQGQHDWIKELPKDPKQLLSDGWEDATHPGKAANHTGRDYFHPETGRKVAFDPGKPGADGFEAIDHYHVYNPEYTNKKVDYYLDINGDPVGKGSKPSHIIPGE